MIKKLVFQLVFIVKFFIVAFKRTLPVIQAVFIVMFGLAVAKYGNVQTTSANDNLPISWTLQNYTGTEYRLEGFSNILDGMDTITIQLPEHSVYELRHNSSNRSRITFFDASSNIIGTYYLEDWADYVVQESPYDTYDYYDFDLESLGLYNTAYGDPDHFYMYVYLDSEVGTTWTATERTDFTTYVNANDVYANYPENPEGRDFYFMNVSDSYYDSAIYSGAYGYVPDKAGAVRLTWSNIDTSCLPFMESGGLESYMRFYHVDDTVTPALIYEVDYDLLDYTYIDVSANPLESPDYGVFITFPEDYDLGYYSDYKIVLYSDDVNYTCVNELNYNLQVDFVSYFYEVRFYDDTTLLSTQLVRYDSLVDEPTDPTKSAHDFTGWVIPSTDRAFRDQLFDFDSYVDPESTTNDVLKLYAQWRPLTITDDPSTTDPTPTAGNILTVLEGFGFESDSGRVALYTLIIVVVSAFLMFKSVGGIAVIIVDLGITIIFSYLGFLPLLVLALAYTGLIGSAVAVFTLGGNEYE